MYKALTNERVTVVRQVSTDNLLMELENQEQIEEGTKISDLFSAKDSNTTNLSTTKPGKRSNTLKDKRRQRLK